MQQSTPSYHYSWILYFRIPIIWKAAQEEWEDLLESYVIARGFVLAYRIGAKVIQGERGHDFLNNANSLCIVEFGKTLPIRQ
jgi:hypothetical protein